jgi:membrane protease YdiL (CAAX protease family)
MAMTLRSFVRRHPVTAYLVLVFGVVWPTLGIPRLAGHSVPPQWQELALSGLAFVVLFGGAVLLTVVTEGRAGVRPLLAGLVQWRIGVGRWLLIAGALPVLTLIVAWASGTLRTPAEGWLQMSLTYMVSGLVVGALLTNLWEETAWTGFVQRRLMTGRGILAAAMLTAGPFTLMHVPGTFQNTAADQAVVTLVAVALLAPFLRYLLGVMFVDTGGSILAVGLLHASFNGAGQMSAAHGGWESLPALLVLVLAVAAYRGWARRSPSRLHRSPSDVHGADTAHAMSSPTLSSPSRSA